MRGCECAGEKVPVEAQSLVEEYRTNALDLVDLLNLNPTAHTRLKVHTYMYTQSLSHYYYTLSLSLQQLVSTLPDHSLPDTLTAVLRASFQEQLSVLQAVDLPNRYQAAQPLLNRQIAVRDSLMCVCFVLTYSHVLSSRL